MRLKDIMSSDVETIQVNETAEDAWNKMFLHQIHHLVVLKGDEVVGIVSDKELDRGYDKTERRKYLIADVMTKDVVTAPADMTAKDAANLMRGHSVGCIPVVEKKRLIGIVTVSDLMEMIGRGVERSGNLY